MSGSLYLALVHHPVRARDGAIVTTSVTNLDVHDLGRLARTYDARACFIVTPIAAQRALVGEILAHWRDTSSARRIPDRKEALSVVRTCASIEEAKVAVAEESGGAPRTLATAAREIDGARVLGFDAARAELARSTTLLLFGTGHGLADDVLLAADALLPPIRSGGYNHLSVRTAAAITLDRLVGEREP
jgi:tRNA (guanine37-N1)-methyltransferase